MKPVLGRISLAFALLAIAFGGINAYFAYRFPGTSPQTIALAFLRWAGAATQVVPMFGLLYTRNAQAAWSAPKKTAWVLWAMGAFPALVFGGLVAALALM
jgi:lipoprotein signal peptidase